MSWRKLFFWLQWKLYTKWERVYFTEAEVEYLIDIVDSWVESHQSLSESEDVEGIFENMAVAIDVREKLWRQLSQ